MHRTTRSGSAAAIPRGWLRGLGRWAVGLAVTCGILISLAGLGIVAAPVSLLTRNLNLAPTIVAVYGSLRSGRAELLGGYQLSWNSRASLLWLPHLVTDFTLEGGDTRITGAVQTGMGGIALQGASGRAGPGLAQLVPGAWDCEITARVADVSFMWGWRSAGASGEITTPQGVCRTAGREVDVPPLKLVMANAGRGALTTLTTVQTQLATISISRDRRLGISIAPAAADVFPQLPRGGPITLDLPF